MSDLIQTNFLKKEQIAKNTWMFSFKKKHPHTAGQYITLFLGNDTRDFTIASSPLDKKYFSLVTKKGKSDFKKKLFSLQVNSVVSYQKPSGGFILQEEDTTPHVFIAGGIGMTPFYSMIHYVHGKKLPIPLYLFVSFSKKEYMIFYKELQEIQEKNPRIRVIYSLSQDIWEGEKGRISKKHIEKHVLQYKQAKYLVAGAQHMVEDTEEVLLKMGIDPKNIRIDIFTGY